MTFQTDSLAAEYAGARTPIFRLAFRNAALTLLTLGIYRFWGKTRMRKYIWSSARLDGAPFEYTGNGLEKFLGFLIAIVFLAIYLGLFQMGLFYFGLSLFSTPETQAQALVQLAAFYVSALAVVPFILFAIYRARRYRMGRTRWRGIRFGMEPGAWGYVWRAMGHWALTILSLGLLLPRQTFWLEKYMTDRTWFGDARFEQGGRWTQLYPAMKHLGIGIALVLGGFGLFALEMPFAGVSVLLIGAVWAVVGAVSYKVQSFGWLARHKRLDGDIAFEARPSTGRVLGIYLVGGIVIGIGSAIAFALLGVVLGLGAGGLYDLDSLSGPQAGPPVWAVLGVILGYLAIMLAAGAAGFALVVQPVLAHYVSTLRVVNSAALARIHQRAADKGADAEGFADALDIGGAI